MHLISLTLSNGKYENPHIIIEDVGSQIHRHTYTLKQTKLSAIGRSLYFYPRLETPASK